MDFVALLSLNQEPQSHEQPKQEPRWVATVEVELKALEENHTWDLVPYLPYKKSIASK